LSVNHYFLTNEVVLHERDIYHIADMLSGLGGLISFVAGIVSYFVVPIVWNFNLALII